MNERSAKTSPERKRVDAAVERWSGAHPGSVRLWSELSERDKERLAMRRLRSVAATLGWDEVLHRIGIRRREQE